MWNYVLLLKGFIVLNPAIFLLQIKIESKRLKFIQAHQCKMLQRFSSTDPYFRNVKFTCFQMARLEIDLQHQLMNSKWNEISQQMFQSKTTSRRKDRLSARGVIQAQYNTRNYFQSVQQPWLLQITINCSILRQSNKRHEMLLQAKHKLPRHMAKIHNFFI